MVGEELQAVCERLLTLLALGEVDALMTPLLLGKTQCQPATGAHFIAL